MLVIRDSNGNVISRSRNLRGIREYVGKNLIKLVAIHKLPDGAGKLSILFDNGATFETSFADFIVLCWSVRNWRNLYNSRLLIDRVDCGLVYYDNYHLIKILT